MAGPVPLSRFPPRVGFGSFFVRPPIMRKINSRFAAVLGILSLICGSIILGGSLLTGCVPYPHTEVWSPAVRGRVLDSSTRIPVNGAKVYFMQSPQNVAYTDESGSFQLKATHKFYLGSGMEGGWPKRDKGPNYAQILHSDDSYYPFMFFDVSGPQNPDTGEINIGDVFLNPTSPKSDICAIHHEKMVKKTVAIYYKNYPMDQRSLALYQASTNIFPHAEEYDIPSFYLAQPGGADIYVCPECQKARDQWVLKYASVH